MPAQRSRRAIGLLRLSRRALETLAHDQPDREHLRHRTSPDDPIEGLPNNTALAMVFKLVEGAQKSWRRLDGHAQLPKLILGVKFADGLEVIAKPRDHQPETAAA